MVMRRSPCGKSFQQKKKRLETPAWEDGQGLLAADTWSPNIQKTLLKSREGWIVDRQGEDLQRLRYGSARSTERK